MTVTIVEERRLRAAACGWMASRAQSEERRAFWQELARAEAASVENVIAFPGAAERDRRRDPGDPPMAAGAK